MLNHPQFWSIHKKVFQRELDALDNRDAAKIMDDPGCPEAMNFNKRIISIVSALLNEKPLTAC